MCLKISPKKLYFHKQIDNNGTNSSFRNLISHFSLLPSRETGHFSCNCAKITLSVSAVCFKVICCKCNLNLNTVWKLPIILPVLDNQSNV